MYVWVDALTNYITGVGFPDDGSERTRRYWPADVHVIGKDIVRFHAVYWPAFLMSAGIAVPKRVFATASCSTAGEKMSKSVGNVVDPFDLADALRRRPGALLLPARGAVRPGRQLQPRGHRQPHQCRPRQRSRQPGAALAVDDRQATAAACCRSRASSPTRQGDPGGGRCACSARRATAMATQQIHQALNAVWAVVAEANRYFAGEAPWALAKTDPAAQETVLYVTAEVVRQVAILAQPVMPDRAAKLLDMPRRARRTRATSRRSGGRGRSRPAHTLPPPAGVFPRYVEAEGGSERLASRCSSTATAISTFRILPRISTASSRAREAAGIGRIVTISTRVKRLGAAARHRRAISERLSARSAPIRITPTRKTAFRPTS